MGLNADFCTAWRFEESFHWLLFRLVEETSSRAAGCWRLKNGFLELVGFGWADDMPVEIRDGFQDATRHVSLEQTGLGIVKAVVTREPAIGRRDPQDSGLDGSATWIAKFGANTSLAVPIRDLKTGRIAGVIAVSTASFVEPHDSLWETLTQLARDIERTDEQVV